MQAIVCLSRELLVIVMIPFMESQMRVAHSLSRTRISFLFFCVEVLIIRYDKMVSHMMPTCAFVFVIKACDPGKDLP
jgi:hypothetical protein